MSEGIPKRDPLERREVSNKMPDDWAELRREILETIPNRTEGLDTGRINEFVSSLDLPVGEYRVLYEEDIPRLRDLLRSRGMDTLTFNGPERGVFLQHVNFSFIKREPEYEAINTSVYTEGMVVHELAHHSGYTPLYVKTEKGMGTPRVGFEVPRSGAFLEEGFADTLRGNYLKQTMRYEVKQKILEQLGSTEDFPLDAEVGQTKDIEGIDFRYHIPLKHFYLTPEGEAETVTSGIAAGGLEMLCQKDPGLFDALLAARGGDVEKLREIPKRINAISPGLYGELLKLQYTEEDFIRGNAEIGRRLSDEE